VTIAALAPAGGPEWTPGSTLPVELGRDPDGTIVVRLELENWTLLGPNTCSTTPQCGFLTLDAEPASNAAAGAPLRLVSVGSAISVPMARVVREGASRYRFVVALHNDGTGDVFTSEDGGRAETSVEFELRRPSADGGTDAGTPDAADAADAGSDAGGTDSGDGASLDGTIPDGNISTDGSSPGDGASPRDGSSPSDGAAPRDARPDVVTGDGSPAPDASPRDAAASG